MEPKSKLTKSLLRTKLSKRTGSREEEKIELRVKYKVSSSYLGYIWSS
jgi:hypothetical protein